MVIFVKMNNRTTIGREGEEAARTFLQSKGYSILHSNWHFHHYELDIVAIDNEMLVVVEVKTRADDYLVAPDEAVDRKKMRRIISAADAYVRYFKIDIPVRFDIVTIVNSREGYKLDHYEDAFLPGIK